MATAVSTGSSAVKELPYFIECVTSIQVPIKTASRVYGAPREVDGGGGNNDPRMCQILTTGKFQIASFYRLVP